MSAGPPVLRDTGALLGFVLAMIALPAFGLYVAGWLLWSAIYSDWVTIMGWLNG